MEIIDIVYGIQKVEEPVLLEIIATKEMQRLKSIAGFGVPDKWYHVKGYKRFEHSLGVMFLLKMLKVSLEEQIAGLVHDISHTAFSHVVDWVFGTEKEENHQDNVHTDFLMNSSLPELLEDYGFDVKTIADYHNFPVLEKDAPALCADRVDYTLREMALYMDKHNVSFVKDSLVAYQGELVFRDSSAAKIFADDYMKCQKEHWGGIQATLRYKLLADAIKFSMKDGIIEYNDFFTDDNTLIKKLEFSRREDVKRNLRLLGSKLDNIIIDEKNPDYFLEKKFRYVDPKFLENGILYILSEIDKKYAGELEKQKAINENGWSIKIL